MYSLQAVLQLFVSIAKCRNNGTFAHFAMRNENYLVFNLGVYAGGPSAAFGLQIPALHS